MPKFHEIYHRAPLEPFRIRTGSGAIASVNNLTVTWESTGTPVNPINLAVYDWHLVREEPTAADIFRERGITEKEAQGGQNRIHLVRGEAFKGPTLYFQQKPVSPELARRICDLLEELK